MTQDERTIRILSWQNGLYLGLLETLLSALGTEMELDDGKAMVHNVREKLKAPLPEWLKEPSTLRTVNAGTGMQSFWLD